MSWMQTYTGRKFDLSNPDPDAILLEDIAHSLSMLCRYTGHCRRFYSVAQHSVLVASLVPEDQRFHALMHDATEAYVGDMSWPLKQIMPAFKEAEQRVWSAIALRFGLPQEQHTPEIKRADSIALMLERRDLMAKPPEPWDTQFEDLVPQLPDIRVVPLCQSDAKMQFRRALYDVLGAVAPVEVTA